MSEIPSPDNKLKVVLSVRDCGATTRASTRLSVIKFTATPPGGASAEVLAAYEYPWNGKTHKVDARWSDTNALNVTYTEDVEMTHFE